MQIILIVNPEETVVLLYLQQLPGEEQNQPVIRVFTVVIQILQKVVMDRDRFRVVMLIVLIQRDGWVVYAGLDAGSLFSK